MLNIGTYGPTLALFAVPRTSPDRTDITELSIAHQNCQQVLVPQSLVDNVAKLISGRGIRLYELCMWSDLTTGRMRWS